MRCEKCNGLVIEDFEDIKCVICGRIYYDVPSNILEDVRKSIGKNFIEKKQSEARYYYDKTDKLYGVET
jgi:hypothetical protein